MNELLICGITKSVGRFRFSQIIVIDKTHRDKTVDS